MIKRPIINTEKRPKLIPSITAGFEIVARHLWLIILPLVLDLVLWFGPHIRVKNLLMPVIENYKIPVELQNTDLTGMFTATKDIYFQLLDRFNLIAGVRTLPVGIPSLIAGTAPLTNPIGQPMMIEVPNLMNALMIWIVISLAGLIGCSYFFNAIGRAVSRDNTTNTPGTLGWQTLQLVYLTVFCIAAILIAIIPALMLITFLTLISPAIGQFALFFAGLLVIWIVTPMLFTPQEIFLHHQPVMRALVNSIRMVRFALPQTGLFFILLIIISQGLNYLWMVPPEDSWLTLVGIGGHALVSTSLIAAIFVYYRDAAGWIRELLQQRYPETSSPKTGQNPDSGA